MHATSRTIRTSDLLEMIRRELPASIDLPASVTLVAGNISPDPDEIDDSRVEVQVAINEVLRWDQ